MSGPCGRPLPRWRLAPAPRQEAAVQITPMADVFAVLVIYLLSTYAVQSVDIRALSDVILPEAGAGPQGSEGLRLSVSAHAIRIDNVPVVSLTGGQLRGADIDGQQRISPLLRALERLRLKAVSGEGARALSAGRRVVVEAGRGLDFGLVERVLHTVRSAGFEEVHLGVRRRALGS